MEKIFDMEKNFDGPIVICENTVVANKLWDDIVAKFGKEILDNVLRPFINGGISVAFNKGVDVVFCHTTKDLVIHLDQGDEGTKSGCFDFTGISHIDGSDGIVIDNPCLT